MQARVKGHASLGQPGLKAERLLATAVAQAGIDHGDTSVAEMDQVTRGQQRALSVIQRHNVEAARADAGEQNQREAGRTQTLKMIQVAVVGGIDQDSVDLTFQQSIDRRAFLGNIVATD